MFKVLGADNLVNGETNGYFGDPVAERRTERCAGARTALMWSFTQCVW